MQPHFLLTYSRKSGIITEYISYIREDVRTMINAAEAMVKCLEKEGVKVVYGYPGAAICPFYDKLFDSTIHHVLVRHEANAGHATNGYARISGRPAVCVATSGPGATNLLTAIATAYMDSVPLICITGQVSTSQIGSDVFQEADITGAALPFVKHSYLVKNAADIPRIFKEAFYIAGTGRKGPVLIDVPIDVSQEKINFDYPESVSMRTYRPTVKGNIMQIKKIANALFSAKKPLICAGGGVFLADAKNELLEFTEKTGIPAVSTMMGLSVYPSNHPLYYGMIGMHGVNAANEAMARCDTLVLIGARAGDRSVSAPKELASHAKVIHIDIDPAEIGKNIPSEYPLVGDCKQILCELIKFPSDKDYSEWNRELSEMRIQVAEKEENKGFVNPKLFLRRLSGIMPENTICVPDVGQNQIWACNNFEMKPAGRLIVNGGMGTMGYSIPAAIGAKMASPDSEVVAVCGDGSFQMMMMELSTIVQEKLPIKIILMKNKRLGMVRELQTNKYKDRQAAVRLVDSPDYVKLVSSYGIPSERVETMQEAEEAAVRMKEAKGAYFIECNVYKYETSL